MAKEYIDWNQGNQGTWSNAESNGFDIGSMMPGVIGAAATVGGHLYDNLNAEQQQGNQMELMDHQMQNQQTLNQQQAAIQQGLNQQGHDLQMQMWENTNAPAQVGMLREAGLNPALMYKQGGPGGVTGGQTGGSAQGGSAAGGNAMQRRQLMDMQNLMMKAQLDNLNANTKKTEAEAENEAGGIKDKLGQEVKNLVEQGKLTVEQTNKTASENEINNINKEILKLDKKFFDTYEISKSEYGYIESMRIGGWKLLDILKTFFDWNWGDGKINPPIKLGNTE